MRLRQWKLSALSALTLCWIPEHNAIPQVGGRAAPSRQADTGLYASAAQRVVDAASTSFQLKRGFAIDSSVRQALASEMTNFAVTYSTVSSCDNVAKGASNAAAGALDAFLVDAVIQRRARLQTFYARLALACGSTSEASGWQSEGANPFGFVTIQNGSRHLAKFIDGEGYSDYGTVEKGIVFTPGRYYLVDIDDNGRPSALQTVIISAGASASMAGRIVVGTSLQGKLSAALPPNYYCLGANGSTEQPRFGHLVSENGSARGARLAPNQPAPFAALPAAVVDVSVVGAVCSHECMDEIALLVARSVAGWRGVCKSCTADSLIALRVGSKVFVDSLALQSLRQDSSLGTRTDSLNPFQSSSLVLGSSQKYISLPAGSVEYRQLCGHTSVDSPKWLPIVRDMVCEKAAGPLGARVAKLNLAFVPQVGACGPADPDSILACGSVDRGLEIGLNGVRYAWTNPQTGTRVVLGSGPDEFDLMFVLLHEIGHWMGLVDVAAEVISSDGKQSIMGDTYATAGACISAGDVAAFAAAADMTWSGRLQSCSGLKRPRASPP